MYLNLQSWTFIYTQAALWNTIHVDITANAGKSILVCITDILYLGLNITQF